MENQIVTKGILATILIVTTYIYNAIGVLFIILLMAMAIDYITGMAAAWINRELNSRAGIIGILKKIGYVGLVLMALLFDLAIIYTVEQAGFEIPLNSLFGILVTAWLFGNEGISIVENLGKIGVPIPKFFPSGLKIFKELIEKINDKEETK